MAGAALTTPAVAAPDPVPLADPPPFRCGPVLFACYLRADGGYVWRSSCGRLACGRVGGRYVVKKDGAPLAEAASLVQVMALGVAALGLAPVVPTLKRTLRRA